MKPRVCEVRKTAAETRVHGHNARLYRIGNEVRSISGWARHFGKVGARCALSRVKRGMGVYEAVTTPLIPQKERFAKNPVRLYCEEHGLNYKFVYDRIRGGMSVEEALSKPKMAKDSPAKKRTIPVVVDGETMTLTGAARKHGVDPSLAVTRVRHCGWSPEAAATIPSAGRRKGCCKAESEECARRHIVADRRRQLASMGIVM